ncbi:MAG: hypothetical protein IJ864_01955 [Alphaproteobacteria bacterium]|nr:hypothetical protein [Alphaproteobacteria bacterium]
MKKYLFCYMCCLMVACSAYAQGKIPFIPEKTTTTTVVAVKNLFFVPTAENAYVFEKKGEDQYKLLVHVAFPCTSEEPTYISKEDGDSVIFRVHFKCHGRWYKKELGKAKEKDGRLNWIRP